MCEVEEDCHNLVQSWPGTHCVEYMCQCPEPGQDVNCDCKPEGQCDVDGGDAGNAGTTGAGGKGDEGNGGGGGGGDPVEEGGGSTIPKPECVTANDCKAPIDAVCGAVQCIDGKCVLDIKVGPVPSQVRGDCERKDCDVTGKLVIVGDPSDVYNDGKQCTYDICVASGKPLNEPGWQGSTCPETKAGVCHEDACVDCLEDSDCASPFASACAVFTCVPEHCRTNVVKDGNETDINCGGSCAPCPETYQCLVNTDCVSLKCIGQKCAPPSCPDGIKNDGETGMDCGGVPSCPACPVGEGCDFPVDCDSSVCWAGQCQEPSCEDGVKNGEESAIDCGGPPCPACPAL